MNEEEIKRFAKERPDFLLALHISGEVSKWLHNKGDSVFQYHINMDMIHDIGEVVEKAIGSYEEPKI